MKRYSKYTIPLAIVAAGLLGAYVVTVARPKPPEKIVEEQPRAIRAISVVPGRQHVDVVTHGTVEPRTEITLIPQVSGKIVEVNSAFVSGGFFREGDLLARIESADFDLAVVRAEARVAEAKQRLMREQAESEQAAKEWEELGEGEASPLVLRKPQLAEARAKLKSANADLAEARLRLERTFIRAPFKGRVRARSADIGQFVSAGSPIGQIYSSTTVEVRLPLTDRQIALLNLPMTEEAAADETQHPSVTLAATFGGKEVYWQGKIVRTEGAIDHISRVVYGVAQVEDPYGKAQDAPLSVGMFVEATIDGRIFENVIKVPREAVRQDGFVLIVGTDSRLHYRPANVLQTGRHDAVLRLEMQEGEMICLSNLDTATENMLVKVVSDEGEGLTKVAGEVIR